MITDLRTTVADLASSDPDLSDDAKLLILGALESDEELAGFLEEPTFVGGHEAAATPKPETPPVGAYLKSIQVSGFRGIGPSTTVRLHPGPGLVVIAGRNGSGKSTIAEALELALTGESYRWKARSAVWTESWRNLHCDNATAIRVDLAEEGSGLTTIGLDWASGARLEDRAAWTQRPGQKREAGLGALGWSAALEMYRPLLSYDELGGVLDGRPTDFFDKLHALLGLERITDARRRLAVVDKNLAAPRATALVMVKQLKVALSASDDPRAQQALTLVSRRLPDLAEIQALAIGTAVPTGESAALDGLSRITAPDPAQVATVADRLRAAVGARAALADEAAELSGRQADLLDRALDLYAVSGDRPCPVCGVGHMDSAWADHTRAELEIARTALAELRTATEMLTASRRDALDVIAAVRPLPALSDPELTTLAAATSAREAFCAPPTGDRALADHLVAAVGPLSDAYAALRAQSTRLSEEREDRWAPLALQLGEWVATRQQWDKQADRAAQVKQAVDWLKDNEAALRNERLAPLAERSRQIWAALRQESNVELGGIRLQGNGNQRKVVLSAEVDGIATGALGVMSQGELHALALALFIPRATMPESPFRFIVLDDPIQAMDPSKVEGFVDVLQRLATDRQVIVLSHDDRLPSAIRRAGVAAQIHEITRHAGSSVTLTNAHHPAMRYLEDAVALARDENVPHEVKLRVVPALCRSALETGAYEVFSARSFAAGADRVAVELAWDDASTLRQRLSLAIHLDSAGAVDGWLTGDRSYAFAMCNKGVHAWKSADLDDDIKTVRAAVKDVRGLLP